VIHYNGSIQRCAELAELGLTEDLITNWVFVTHRWTWQADMGELTEWEEAVPDEDPDEWETVASEAVVGYYGTISGERRKRWRASPPSYGA